MNRLTSILGAGLAAILVVVVPPISAQQTKGAAAKPSRPNCYVLAVGINAYKNGPLKGCLNDAVNIAEHFKKQEGRLFHRVGCTIVLDERATKRGIDDGLDQMRTKGQAGDYIVLFLSGHGACHASQWYFAPHDSEPGKVTGRQILHLADGLAQEGKKVFVIIDACNAGQLRLNAKNYLDRRHGNGGGLVLMVSSMPGQTSADLRDYSAFAKAVVDGLAGYADLDEDGYVTIRELRRFAYHRVYDLISQGTKQDSDIDYSLSVSEELKLAVAMKPTTTLAARPAPPKRPAQPSAPAPSTAPAPANAAGGLTGTTWAGRENLANYRDLRFQFLVNGQAVMTDTQGVTNGSWKQQGDTVTLTFDNTV